jgi:CRISPR-associated protein Cas1
MSTLYIDRKGIEVRTDGEALAFYDNQQRVSTIPIAPLERVFIRGDVTLAGSVLGKLGEAGVGVVVLSGRKGRPTMMLGQPHNDASRRVAQYELAQDTDFCVLFTQAVVEAKINAQLELLGELRDRYHAQRYELTVRIRHLIATRSKINTTNQIASLRGLEGNAARDYFAGLKSILADSLGFEGRKRRPPPDPFNAILSLSYTLLHSEAVLSLHGMGFDPFIGFYHCIHFGRESLACDVIEPLRPQIDRFAVRLFKSGVLSASDFSMTKDGCFLGKAGRAKFYVEYENNLHTIRKLLEDTLKALLQAVYKKQEQIQAKYKPQLDAEALEEI